MGSGKSSLRKELVKEANFSGRSFDFDDELFHRHANNTHEHLGEVIESVGWEKFRGVERALLNEVLNESDDGLYSLGGGTLEGGGAELIQKTDAKLVWINTAPCECWERVRAFEHRPLVKKGEQAFYDLYEKRLAQYKKAHLELKSGDLEGLSMKKLLEILA